MIKIVIYDQVSIYEASLECLGRTQAGETSGDFRQDLQPSGVACSWDDSTCSYGIIRAEWKRVGGKNMLNYKC